VIQVNVSPAWITVGGLDQTTAIDLMHAAPQPPFKAGAQYLATCAANLLYLHHQLADRAEWRDPHNKLFEARAIQFLSKLREEPPGDYEKNFPFKTVCDDFQLQIFTHARRLKCVAMAPTALGTGKTKMTIDIAAAKFLADEIDCMAVIAPNGVQRQWITKGLPEHMSDAVPWAGFVWKPRVNLPPRVRDRQPVTRSFRLLRVMTFNVEAFSTDSGLAYKALKAFMATGRCLLVMDESTRIKNHKAQRTRAIDKLAPFAAARIILTGTPITKGYEDFYSQYHFLDPNIIGLSNYYAFRNRYCITVPAFAGAARGQVNIVGYKFQEELFRKLAPVTFMVPPSVLGLGEPRKLRREVEMTPEQINVYGMLAERLVADLMAERIARPQNVLVELLRLQQVLCGWAYEESVDENGLETSVPVSIPTNRPRALRQLIEDTDEPSLIWARFSPDIDMIGDMFDTMNAALAKAGKPIRRFATYDGRVKKTSVREERVDAFGAGNLEHIVGNAHAGGTGVDGLQYNCSLAIYYSNSFDREKRWQSEGRIYRRGQKDIGNVRFADLIVPGTVDELFLDAFAETEDLARRVLRNPAMLTGGLK
jgi:hypothetical protein